MGRKLDAALAASQQAISALAAASDAFPPLKSAAGGLISLIQIRERIHSNKENYAEILKRITTIARDLANVSSKLPDPSVFHNELRIEDFKSTLEELSTCLEPVSKRSKLSSAIHATADDHMLQGCRDKLESYMRDFQFRIDLVQYLTSARIQEQATAQAQQLSPALIASAVVDEIHRRPYLYPDKPPKNQHEHPEELIHFKAVGIRFSFSVEEGIMLHITTGTVVFFLDCPGACVLNSMIV